MQVTGRQIYLFFASLKLAVVSLLGSAAVLAAGTIIESMYGMRAAHLMVYGTWWFNGLLFILGVNVFCAASVRYPWKPHQTGFVITHAGIIIILVGSLMTQRWGLDGNLPVTEGKTNDAVILNDLKLLVTNEDTGKSLAFPVPESGRAKSGALMRVQLSPDTAVLIDRFYPRAVAKQNLKDSPLGTIGRPSITLLLDSSRFTLEEKLTIKKPDGPTEFRAGPAIFSFEKLWTKSAETKFLNHKKPTAVPSKSKGFVVVSLSGREYRLSINDLLKSWQPMGSTGHRIRVEKYYTHAIVQDNELVNKSLELINPAVKLNILSKEGNKEIHTLFANFPEFPTLHRRTSGSNVLKELRVKMISAAQANPELGIVGRNRGELRIAQSADNKRLLYKVISRTGKINGKGEVKPGDRLETGWMDAKFTVLEWKPAGVQAFEPSSVDRIPDSSTNYLSAVRYKLESKRDIASNKSGPQWLMQGDVKREVIGNRRLLLQLTKETLSLPFKIELEKFMIGTDPGTEKAASYASDVQVKDAREGLEKKAHISMNEPLEYRGYTFYQASYQKREGQPSISIFSVNRDPGRPVKYAGSIFLCLGIIIMFYMNPHYFEILLGKKKP